MWKEIIYQYDGSFAGLLCCIYESYTQKERPTAFFCDEDAELCLYEVRAVPTVQEHAARVERSLRKLSSDVPSFLRRVFLTCLEEKELAIYRFVAKLYREGKAYLTKLSDDDYQPLLRAVRNMSTEVEHLRGFLRFSIYEGILSAEIEPKNRVLPLLRAHFCERCHEESFFIYDRTHREALFYANGRSRIVPLDSFEAAPPDAEEAVYRRLWKRFYDTVAIRERENPRLRMTHMPKRYWRTMTEFQAENDAPSALPSVESVTEQRQ
ncbi:MAG: DNA metabolism protein [Ruminococcaceae bacterium]|nr:DNA metabolism protein [Oscillospiraceae bacterium]